MSTIELTSHTGPRGGFWADTINVAPGERYSVLFHAGELGTWVWHCHILTHVERDTGMFGMATAVIVADE